MVSAIQNCGSGIVYQNSRLKLQDVVSVSIFKDVMLLAAILCYLGYRNGVKKDQ